MNTPATLDSKDLKRLRQIAHHLDPVVTLVDTDISEGIAKETNRALRDHELIKVKVNLPDKASRQAAAAELAELSGAQIVQHIGKVCVVYRKNSKANPKLSNLARFG